jgi:hypothetical protein
MGVEAEAFKKKWKRDKVGGTTSNEEESDEKHEHQTFGDFVHKSR